MSYLYLNCLKSRASQSHLCGVSLAHPNSPCNTICSAMQHVFPQHAHDVFRGVPLVYPREIDDACERIRDATDGLGVNEQVLVQVLGSLSTSDRALLIYRYKDLYREELKDTLSRETIGDIRFLLLLLTMPLPEAEAFLLNMATSSSGTKERLLYPVRCQQHRLLVPTIPCSCVSLFFPCLTHCLYRDNAGKDPAGPHEPRALGAQVHVLLHLQ